MVRRVTQSGALPVSRDAPGYSAVLRLLGVADAGPDSDGLGSTLNGEAARAGETAGVCGASRACGLEKARAPDALCYSRMVPKGVAFRPNDKLSRRRLRMADGKERRFFVTAVGYEM